MLLIQVGFTFDPAAQVTGFYAIAHDINKCADAVQRDTILHLSLIGKFVFFHADSSISAAF